MQAVRKHSRDDPDVVSTYTFTLKRLNSLSIPQLELLLEMLTKARKAGHSFIQFQDFSRILRESMEAKFDRRRVEQLFSPHYHKKK